MTTPKQMHHTLANRRHECDPLPLDCSGMIDRLDRASSLFDVAETAWADLMIADALWPYTRAAVVTTDGVLVIACLNPVVKYELQHRLPELTRKMRLQVRGIKRLRLEIG